MQVLKRDKLYNVHSRFNEPGITIKPGEVFKAETEMNSGGWLNSIDDRWYPGITQWVNPTVCAAVDGAEPGDILAVHIREIKPASLGYTGFDGNLHRLSNLIRPNNRWGVTTRTVEIKDGYVHWSDKIKIPVKPMIGTLGVAPEVEVIGNVSAGRHGGNMDVQEVTTGSTVYLPVFVPGALLHIGDVHAVQGDGEINSGGGIECRAEVVLSVDVIKDSKLPGCVRIENDEYIMSVACGRSVEECFQQAAGDILQWMVEGYGFDEQEAYLLMGQVLEARATQFVNPTHSYICKIPKRYLNPNA